MPHRPPAASAAVAQKDRIAVRALHRGGLSNEGKRFRNRRLVWKTPTPTLTIRSASNDNTCRGQPQPGEGARPQPRWQWPAYTGICATIMLRVCGALLALLGLLT